MALFGLNGIADFGARYLDKTIGGRFWSVDPLADVVPSMTPYRYAFNNPVNVTDPTGMLEDDDKKMDFTYTDGYGTYSSRGLTSSINFNGAYNAVSGGDKGKKGLQNAPSIPTLPRPQLDVQPNKPTINLNSIVTMSTVFAVLSLIMEGDEPNRARIELGYIPRLSANGHNIIGISPNQHTVTSWFEQYRNGNVKPGVDYDPSIFTPILPEKMERYLKMGLQIESKRITQEQYSMAAGTISVKVGAGVANYNFLYNNCVINCVQVLKSAGYNPPNNTGLTPSQLFQWFKTNP